jgi:hypothetical protein
LIGGRFSQWVSERFDDAAHCLPSTWIMTGAEVEVAEMPVDLGGKALDPQKQISVEGHVKVFLFWGYAVSAVQKPDVGPA